MNKQELIKKYEHIYEVSHRPFVDGGLFSRGEDSGSARCSFEIIEDLKQLDEPQKVKVPQFGADWIEQAKEEDRTLFEVMDDIYGSCYYHKGDDETYKWLFGYDESPENQKTFAKAYLDGYEVEEEPKWKIINDQKYCLTSIEAGYGNSLHWAFDSTKKKPILFDNEETALYTAYITGGTVEKVEV